MNSNTAIILCNINVVGLALHPSWGFAVAAGLWLVVYFMCKE